MGEASNSPVRVPARVRPGQAIEAAQYNALVDAVRALTERGGGPLVPPRPVEKLPPFWVSFWYDAAAGAYKFKVAPGYVTFQNIQDSDVVGYWVPTLGGTAVEAEPWPTGTLPANTCFLYVRVVTNDKGAIENTPTIVSASSEQASTHHEPPDEEDDPGQAGDYYFLIAEFEEVGGVPVPKRRITGNKHVPNQLVEFDNVGSGKKIHRDYLPGTDDKHELRTIKERDSQPQIQVKYDNEAGGGDEIDADEIIVEGNGIDGSLSFEDCDGNPLGTISWVDGLITTATALTIEAGCDSETSV